MNNVHKLVKSPSLGLEKAIDAAVQRIPPAWPLDSSVAVNPFIGQSGDTLATAAARLGRIADIAVVMPRDWYWQKIVRGEITDADLQEALYASPYRHKPADLRALKNAAQATAERTAALPTIADLAASTSGIDWPGLVDDRFGIWAGGYFDQGQALWSTSRRDGPWKNWRSWATHDLTPEIHGLRNFCDFVERLADSPFVAIAQAIDRLGVSEKSLESYFHQLLLSLGGWSQYARHKLWKAELAGDTDTTLAELMAIRLAWEEALLCQHEKDILPQWRVIVKKHAEPVEPSIAQIIDEILQEAAERSGQRTLFDALEAPQMSKAADRPVLQAAFCIDVRSEVFRRALESVSPSIRTIGFAGFFGLLTKHRRFGSVIEEKRFPVLLNSAVTSCSGKAEDTPNSAEQKQRYRARATRAWGRFKLAAVSSFAFVEAMGPAYLLKLLRGALSLQSMGGPDDSAPRFDPALDVQTRTDAAEKILRAMSLTEGFGRIVLIAGHGASMVNNPYASSLQCGACGGYSGDVNARLLALILNDREVRSGLAECGIDIPQDTLFVAALHDTTTDNVTLFDRDIDSSTHAAELEQVRGWLGRAGRITRGERMARLPAADKQQDVEARAYDWAEVRPEWGLAGCQAFIAAPRSRTAGRKLGGRAFLHDYDWKQDELNDYPVLELIMTAPVVVASWISLQYYGSSVAPRVFGSGNKLLHNVVGGIGVLEGNGGVMRAGLPWQSVHDGENFVHEPLRLSVCIEAPKEAMTKILKRHQTVRALFDNRWLHLFAIDKDGKITSRYTGNLAWEPITEVGVVGTELRALA
jgi:uncharacterized protein YbcC (UPF0753/DUF2309 family)